MKKIRIGVIGIQGRMGQEICALLSSSSLLSYSCGVDRNPVKDHSIFASLDDIDPSSLDVLIDFSSRESLKKTLQWCQRNGKPLVAGVTGLDSEEKDLIKAAAQWIPVLWSANMSLGVAVMRKMLQAFQDLTHFDFAITEVHHNKKIDNPSGTALVLYEDLVKVVQKPIPPPVGIRGGGVFGVHTVFAMSNEETISLEHQALNRTVFARGALRAAEWIFNKKPGYYEILDVLG